jgi:flagellar biosynthesis/type III secretory pathway protein FliH
MLADLRILTAELQAATEQTQAQREQEASAGYAAGLRQAQEEVDKERGRLLEDVSQLRKLFSSSLEDRLSKVDEFAVEIAFAALTRIVGEHFGDGTFARAVVLKAVTSVRGAKKVAVHVAQQDLDLIRRLEGELLSTGQISEFEFVPDPRVTVGGCLIETETGVWDARLETQLQRLRDAIDASIRAKD